MSDKSRNELQTISLFIWGNQSFLFMKKSVRIIYTKHITYLLLNFDLFSHLSLVSLVFHFLQNGLAF